MHALDAAQLDIAGGRWTGDEGEWPPFSMHCIRESRDRLWHEIHDLVFIDHTEVVVWEQRNGTAALMCTIVQHDRTRLGNTQRAARQDPIALIQLLIGQCICVAISPQLD